MEPSSGGVDELVEFWTLLDEDQELLVGKRGATGLGFASLLNRYSRHGRFPRARADLPDAAVEFVARHMAVDGADLDAYEWSGSTIDYHRGPIRAHFGFRVATVADQEKLTGWLVENVTHAEPRPERVREELLVQFRSVRLEPPTPARLTRMMHSAIRTADQCWAARISNRLDLSTKARLLNLIVDAGEAGAGADVGARGSDTVLGVIKSTSGNVSLESDDGRDRQAASGPSSRPPGRVARGCGTKSSRWVAGPGGGRGAGGSTAPCRTPDRHLAGGAGSPALTTR